MQILLLEYDQISEQSSKAKVYPNLNQGRYDSHGIRSGLTQILSLRKERVKVALDEISNHKVKKEHALQFLEYLGKYAYNFSVT